MSSFCTFTGTKSWTPLADRVVDDALLQTVPHVNQTLFQIVNVSHLRPRNTVLRRTPHLVVHTGLRSELLGGHRLGAVKAGTSRCSNATVTRALWAGALSCWKMKKSPEIARICYIIIVHPNSLRPYHTTLGPAADPTCSKILAPPLVLNAEKSSQHHLHLRLWHALLKCSVPCWTYRPHSTQRTTDAQLFWLYCATDIVLTSLTPTSTRSCTSLTLKSSIKISSYP